MTIGPIERLAIFTSITFIHMFESSINGQRLVGSHLYIDVVLTRINTFDHVFLNCFNNLSTSAQGQTLLNSTSSRASKCQFSSDSSFSRTHVGESYLWLVAAMSAITTEDRNRHFEEVCSSCYSVSSLECYFLSIATVVKHRSGWNWHQCCTQMNRLVSQDAHIDVVIFEHIQHSASYFFGLRSTRSQCTSIGSQTTTWAVKTQVCGKICYASSLVNNGKSNLFVGSCFSCRQVNLVPLFFVGS